MRGTHARGNEDGLTKRQLLRPDTVVRSRQLRRDRTPAEDRLWRALRDAFPHAKFRFQVPLGPYHADFCSHGAKLVIEADGGQHADTAEYDEARTRFLNAEGYRVICFWNNDIIQNIDGVMTVVGQPLPLCGRGRAQSAVWGGGGDS
ncbi:MAG: hypothetical protein AVDCRST_MAG91-3409, partial [uncultured Sphingomonadaceae bacterium]